MVIRILTWWRRWLSWTKRRMWKRVRILLWRRLPVSHWVSCRFQSLVGCVCQSTTPWRKRCCVRGRVLCQVRHCHKLTRKGCTRPSWRTQVCQPQSCLRTWVRWRRVTSSTSKRLVARRWRMRLLKSVSWSPIRCKTRSSWTLRRTWWHWLVVRQLVWTHTVCW